MGFFNDIGNMFSGPGGPARLLGDVFTFGGNEILGNPIGNMFFPPNPNKDQNYWNQQQMNLTAQQMQLQKEFAQNGISWRVADAARNGIAPLAALGASEPSYAPVASVFSSSPVQPSLGTQMLSAAIPEMGQGVARALLTQKSPQERQAALLDLAWKSKQNDLLDVQIANAKLELARHALSPGVPLAYQDIQNFDGTFSRIPSEDAARGSHGQFMGPIMWSLNNKWWPAYALRGAQWLGGRAALSLR